MLENQRAQAVGMPLPLCFSAAVHSVACSGCPPVSEFALEPSLLRASCDTGWSEQGSAEASGPSHYLLGFCFETGLVLDD